MNIMPEREEQPTDDRNNTIGPEINIPGPYPFGRVDPTGEPLSSESELTKKTRCTGSLGSLTAETSTSTMREETGGLGSPMYDEERSSK
jgi:hypothetical protein